MRVPSILVLPAFTILGTAAAYAQATAPKKSDAAKPPVHKADQSALNLTKQDERAKKEKKDAIEQLQKAVKGNETAEKELQRELDRLNKDDVKKDPEKVIEAVKNAISPESLRELKKSTTKLLDSDEARRAIEDLKKKRDAGKSDPAKPKTPVNPSAPVKPSSSTFDNVPPPAPAETGPSEKKPRASTMEIGAQHMLYPPTSDPNFPDRPIAPENPLARTFVWTGNAWMKSPSFAINADKIIALKDIDTSGQGLMGAADTRKPAPPAAKTPKNTTDPVQPGASTAEAPRDEAPLERLTATGSVKVVRIVKGVIQYGEGGRMIYEKKTGQIELTIWPSVQRGSELIIPTRQDAKIILYANGKEPYTLWCRTTILEKGDPKATQTLTDSLKPLPSPASTNKPAARRATEVQ